MRDRGLSGLRIQTRNFNDYIRLRPLEKLIERSGGLAELRFQTESVVVVRRPAPPMDTNYSKRIYRTLVKQKTGKRFGNIAVTDECGTQVLRLAGVTVSAA